MYKTSLLIKYVQRNREIVIVLSILYYNPNPNPPAAACTKSCVTHWEKKKYNVHEVGLPEELVNAQVGYEVFYII